MLTTSDFLNICLGVGFLFLVGSISYAFYNLALLIKSFREMVDRVSSVGDGIKFGILSFVKKFIIRKGVR